VSKLTAPYPEYSTL